MPRKGQSEIARFIRTQTRFVTAEMVEGHLTHVFYKLDVKARSALRAALAAPTSAVRT